MMTDFSPRLILAALGLISAIGGGLLLDVTGGSVASVPSNAGAIARPVDAIPQPIPLAYAVPGEQQAFVWGYVFSPDLVPDLSWMQLSQGTQYRLFDEAHQCIGIVTAAGEAKLLHWFPDICSPAPASPQGEVTAHG